MKIFNYLLCLGCVLFFTGCPAKNNNIEPIYHTETQDVYIPVYCNAPKVECEFTGGGTITLSKVMKCISTQKAALAFCSKENMEKHTDTLIELSKKQKESNTTSNQ